MDPVFVMPALDSHAPSHTSSPPSPVQFTDQIALVRESLTVHNFTPAPQASVLLIPAENWTWQEVRDYVVAQIVKFHGVFPRNDKKELGIFRAFCTRWALDAPDIARYAFETMNGYWMNAPISINRFCKGSDPYFAQRIVDHLNWNVRPS